MHLKRLLILILSCATFGLLLLGCSGNHPATLPTAAGEPRISEDSHISWGIWQMKADPAAGTLNVTPLRTVDIHLNALPLLEPPPWAYLTIESDLEFSGPGGTILDVDIGLKHPYAGFNQYAGFDVKGILILHLITKIIFFLRN